MGIPNDILIIVGLVLLSVYLPDGDVRQAVSQGGAA